GAHVDQPVGRRAGSLRRQGHQAANLRLSGHPQVVAGHAGRLGPPGQDFRIECGGGGGIGRQQLVPDESSPDIGVAHDEVSSFLRATSSTVDDRRDILPCRAVHCHDCCVNSLRVCCRSRQIRYRPLAMTRPPPRHTRSGGSTCQTNRSMAMPQSRAVYSKGATSEGGAERKASVSRYCPIAASTPRARSHGRSEEHTSELQSLRHLVCRLLLEKKKEE